MGFNRLVYQREWRKRNPDKVKLYNSKTSSYRKNHRDLINNQKKIHRIKNHNSMLEHERSYTRNNPWIRILKNINTRCSNHKIPAYKYYGGRGIKNFLAAKDIKFIWNRDTAWKMKRPSIDRIDPDGDYEIGNCRFVELSENISRKRRGSCQTTR